MESPAGGLQKSMGRKPVVKQPSPFRSLHRHKKQGVTQHLLMQNTPLMPSTPGLWELIPMNCSYRSRTVVNRLLKLRKPWSDRSEEHTSELQSRGHLVCR